MPLLEVEVVGDTSDSAAKAIADAVAHLLRADKGTVWVRLRTLPKNQYAENGSAVEQGPVFVKVLLAELPGPVEVATMAADLALAIGKACGVDSSHVHIFYEPPGVGRAAFGGRILE